MGIWSYREGDVFFLVSNLSKGGKVNISGQIFGWRLQRSLVQDISFVSFLNNDKFK